MEEKQQPHESRHGPGLISADLGFMSCCRYMEPTFPLRITRLVVGMVGRRPVDGSQDDARHDCGVLGQETVAHESNESPAVRTLTAGLDLEGRVVTLDTMHVRHDTARCAVERCAAHYT